MKINSYRFGEMIIDGQEYTTDLVIHSEEIHTPWLRQEGHTVFWADLSKWISKDCRRLIVGTGASGLCEILPEVEQYCRDRSIEFIAAPTAKAIEAFNTLSDKSHAVAAFHLTC